MWTLRTFTLYFREEVLIHGGSGGGFYSVYCFNDERLGIFLWNPPATVSVHTTASNQAGNSHRPSLPQVKPPPPLNLADCSAKRWKLWKQTWLNFAIVSKFSTQGEAYQKALFLCTIGQSALENQRISVHCERRFKQGRHDNRQVWPILHRWRKRDVRALQIQPTQSRSWWKLRCLPDRPQKHDRHM